MIEQHVDDPYPEGAVLVEAEGIVARIYFANDIEAKQEAERALTAIKMVSKVSVKNQCGERILSGFSSDVTGTTKQYRAKIEDQLNIISAAVAGVAAQVSIDGAREFINPAQINKLNKQMVADREAVLTEKDIRCSAVDAAITEEEIDLIINKEWS